MFKKIVKWYFIGVAVVNTLTPLVAYITGNLVRLGKIKDELVVHNLCTINDMMVMTMRTTTKKGLFSMD